MNTQRMIVIGILAAACFGLTTTPIANAQELLHARVSAEAGGGMVRGTADDDWSYATVNTLIMPGDTLWADESGLLELEMSGGTFLRLADGSKAEIVQLPPSAFVRGWHGSFYVQRVARSKRDASFDTPAGRVNIEPNTMVRVDIIPSGAATVSVRWGRAQVRTDQGSPVTVSEGRRVFIDPGLLPSTPVFFDRTEEDAFDKWNRERARLLAVGPEPLSAERTSQSHLGIYDLDQYGEWVTVDNSRYWRPTVIREYVPYRAGHWSYVPTYGHVWVGDYPFCYVTSHYGRWTHHSRHGWMWTYRETWAPAWAATIRVGSHYVWTPLDPYNRPVRVTSSSYYEVGGLRFSVMASSYSSVSELYLGPARVRPVTQTVVNQTIIVGDVHIWNIGTQDQFRPRVPYRRELPHTRDYAPRRTIRGPETGSRSVVARSRVDALESSMGRRDFRSVEVTGARSVRTPASGLDRQNALRRVSIPTDAPTDAQSFLRSDAVTRATRSPRPETTRATRGAPIETPHATTTRTVERTPRTTSPRSESPANSTGVSESGRTVRQAPGQDAGRASSVERTPAPSRTPERPTVTRTPDRTPSVRETTPRSTSTRIEARPTPPATPSNQGRTVRTAPNTEPQRTPTVDRSPRQVTITPPRSESPARTERPAATIRSPQQTTAPRQAPTPQPRVQAQPQPAQPRVQSRPQPAQPQIQTRPLPTTPTQPPQQSRGFSLPQAQPSRPQAQQQPSARQSAPAQPQRPSASAPAPQASSPRAASPATPSRGSVSSTRPTAPSRSTTRSSQPSSGIVRRSR